MRKIFRANGFLFRALNNLTDILVLSVMWILGCLGIVTAGAATTALYDSVVHCVRYRQPEPYRRFWNTFKSGLKVTIGTTVLWGLIIGVGVLCLSFLRAAGENSRLFTVFSVIYSILLAIPIGAACWAFPVFSRFSYGLKNLNLTALRMTIGYLPRTAILVVLAVEGFQLCTKLIFPAFFVPACFALLDSLLIEPVFQKFGGGLEKEEEE